MVWHIWYFDPASLPHTWYNTVREKELPSEQGGIMWYCMVRYGIARYSTSYGIAWYGMVMHGMV